MRSRIAPPPHTTHSLLPLLSLTVAAITIFVTILFLSRSSSKRTMEPYVSVHHIQPSHRVFVADLDGGLPPDVASALRAKEADGITLLTEYEERENRGYRHRTSSFAHVRDILSAVTVAKDDNNNNDDDDQRLVIAISGSDSYLLLIWPASGGSYVVPTTLEEAIKAMPAPQIRCAGRAAAAAASTAVVLALAGKNENVSPPDMVSIDETPEAVLAGVEGRVTALWGTPARLKRLTKDVSATVGIRCLQYTSVSKSASVSDMIPGMMVSDVDVANFIPEVRIGTQKGNRVVSAFSCPVALFASASSGEDMVPVFRAVARSEPGGVEHVAMTNFVLLVRPSMKMVVGLDKEMESENARLGIESTVETFVDENSIKPQVVTPPSHIKLRLVASLPLYHRGRDEERLRRYKIAMATPLLQYVRVGDVLVLSHQLDARDNGPYFVTAVTSSSSEATIASHWEFPVPTRNFTVADMQSRTVTLPLPSGVHLYRDAPCVITVMDGSSSYLVCRADKVDAQSGMLHLRIVSVQPDDRVADDDATEEHRQLGIGYSCFPGESRDRLPIITNTQSSCLAAGGVWDEPCRADEDCPFFRIGRSLGGCDIASGGLCEMPIGVTRIGFRKFQGSPTRDPPSFAFERLRPSD